MPPVFRALRSAGRGFGRAGRAALVFAFLSFPAIGPAGDAAPVSAEVRAGAVGATVLPEGNAPFPGVSPSGPGPAETAREPGGPDGNGGVRRTRDRAAGFTASDPDRPVSAVRASAAERERLGHASALHRIAAGHVSFHCDTPPPARA